MSGVRLALAILWMQAAMSGASTASVLDARAVPYLDDVGRASYERWLQVNLPRAVAISPGGGIGWAGGSFYDSVEETREKALKSCEAKGMPGCALYADGLDVVWPGQESHGLRPPGALLETWSYEFVPDERFLWHGPSVASGVYVWAHGNSETADKDRRGIQPYSVARPFNNNGYDVIRFDRQPMSDARDRAAGWLRDGLKEMRRLGYRRVIVGGESRGAWNSLQMLDMQGLADAVIAISPAAHSSGGSTNLSAQVDDLRTMLSSIPPSQTRVAFVQFTGDLFMSDPERRAELMRGAAPRLGALLLLDRPEGLNGHDAGISFDFSQRYGRCLMHFALDVTPLRSCPGQPH